MKSQKLLKHFVIGTILLMGAGCTGGGMNSTGTNAFQTAPQVSQAAPMISNASSSSLLTGLLAQRLGVTQPQATGGAGAIFQLAKSQMQASAFSKLSNSVPGMQGMLAAAPSAQAYNGSGLGGMAGRLAGMAGNSGGTAGNLLGLASSFQQLGLAPGMVQQFIPIILQYVQGTSGGGVSSLLQSAVLGGM